MLQSSERKAAASACVCQWFSDAQFAVAGDQIRPPCTRTETKMATAQRQNKLYTSSAITEYYVAMPGHIWQEFRAGRFTNTLVALAWKHSHRARLPFGDVSGTNPDSNPMHGLYKQHVCASLSTIAFSIPFSANNSCAQLMQQRGNMCTVKHLTATNPSELLLSQSESFQVICRGHTPLVPQLRGAARYTC